jgi:hypothetical protein
MKHVWTKNKLPLSWLIRIVTGQDCSHYSLHFPALGLVLHSNLIGVHADTMSNFQAAGNMVIHEKEVPASRRQEMEALIAMLSQAAGDRYPILGLLYAGFWQLLHRFIPRIQVPKHNAWANSRMWVCTRIYDLAPDWIIPVIPELEDMNMIPPHQLWEKLSGES